MKPLVIISLLVITVVIAFYIFFRDPDLSAYDALTSPRITRMDNQKMLVVSLRGDPDVAAKQAFSTLFKAFYKSAGKEDKRLRKAPRARWSFADIAQPKDRWEGRYALPVSDGFPDLRGGQAVTEVWEYGDVAEILHVGSYESEPPTINRLQDFIKAQGYAIVGDHEEEYLKGPGMFFRGNPDRYKTLIRYRIRKP